MLGGVYGEPGKCPHCREPLKDMGQRYEITCINPSCQGYLKYRPPKYRVKFTRGVRKKFGGPNRYARAHQYLGGLRAKAGDPETHGAFDPRDYDHRRPMAASIIIKEYLDKRKIHAERGTASKSQYRNLHNYFSRASEAWGDRNIKNIEYADIDDFLDELDCSDKTRANYRSGIHSFFTWACKRYKFPMPEIPTVHFELGYRTITDKETQEKILVWIKEHWADEPRRWIAIQWLCKYGALRPDDIRRIHEKDVNYKIGRVTITRPTKRKKSRTIWLDDEDLDLIRGLDRGLPEMPLFRHDKEYNGIKRGRVFGKDFLSARTWKVACDALGIEGVSLYPGTRHTSATALQDDDEITRDEIKEHFTQHETNEAFERYMMPSRERAIRLVKLASKSKKKRESEEGRVISIGGPPVAPATDK